MIPVSCRGVKRSPGVLVSNVDSRPVPHQDPDQGEVVVQHGLHNAQNSSNLHDHDAMLKQIEER